MYLSTGGRAGCCRFRGPEGVRSGVGLGTRLPFCPGASKSRMNQNTPEQEFRHLVVTFLPPPSRLRRVGTQSTPVRVSSRQNRQTYLLFSTSGRWQRWGSVVVGLG